MVTNGGLRGRPDALKSEAGLRQNSRGFLNVTSDATVEHISSIYPRQYYDIYLSPPDHRSALYAAFQALETFADHWRQRWPRYNFFHDLTSWYQVLCSNAKLRDKMKLVATPWCPCTSGEPDFPFTFGSNVTCVTVQEERRAESWTELNWAASEQRLNQISEITLCSVSYFLRRVCVIVFYQLTGQLDLRRAPSPDCLVALRLHTNELHLSQIASSLSKGTTHILGTHASLQKRASYTFNKLISSLHNIR